MKKFFLSLAVLVMALCANAQTNQYFWYNGNLMMGNPIAQIDSVTFGEGEPADTLHIMLPRTIIKTVHDTLYITIHDTVCPNDLPEGALAGEFSVSSTKKVRFSKGNLQYNAALGTHLCADGTTKQGTWRFAEHQWDTIGMTQCDKSATYNAWISAYSWGTSGWNSGANKYQPWDYSANRPSDFFVGGNQNNDLIGDYAYADWGVYNAIVNGGNEPNSWRTLTEEEWEYVLKQRTNYQQLCSFADVDGIEGMILLPDDFVMPDGINFTPSPKPSQNHYSISEWLLMENNGAVFLPNESGYITDLLMQGQPFACQLQTNTYWSATHLDGYRSSSIFLPDLEVWNHRYRCDSGQVRLVQDIK